MFKRTKEKLTEEDISLFESTFDLKLPNNLKMLLLKYNGGVLNGETMEDKVVFINGEKATYSFSALYSIKYGLNTIEESINNYQITEKHIPRDYIPFGDGNGGPYTISTKEEEYGNIHIWYMDVGEPEKELVANTLEEFFGVESFE